MKTVLHKSTILESAARLFERMGIIRVTMEDISRELSISKKTLYVFYPHKQELVKEYLQSRCNRITDQFYALVHQDGNTLERLRRLNHYAISEALSWNPILINDLKKHNIRHYKSLEKVRETFKLHLTQLLKQGQAEDLFRKEINTSVLAEMRIRQIESSVDRLYLEGKHELLKEQHQLFDHYIIGILKRVDHLLFKSTPEPVIPGQ